MRFILRRARAGVVGIIRETIEARTMTTRGEALDCVLSLSALRRDVCRWLLSLAAVLEYYYTAMQARVCGFFSNRFECYYLLRDLEWIGLLVEIGWIFGRQKSEKWREVKYRIFLCVYIQIKWRDGKFGADLNIEYFIFIGFIWFI